MCVSVCFCANCALHELIMSRSYKYLHSQTALSAATEAKSLFATVTNGLTPPGPGAHLGQPFAFLAPNENGTERESEPPLLKLIPHMTTQRDLLGEPTPTLRRPPQLLQGREVEQRRHARGRMVPSPARASTRRATSSSGRPDGRVRARSQIRQRHAGAQRVAEGLPWGDGTSPSEMNLVLARRLHCGAARYRPGTSGFRAGYRAAAAFPLRSLLYPVDNSRSVAFRHSALVPFGSPEQGDTSGQP